MRVIITQLDMSNPKEPIVEMRSDRGTCKASWKGSVPVVPSVYEIEVDIPFCLRWGTDIVLWGKEVPKVEMHNDSVTLTGMLNSVDEAIASLRIANDITLVETEGEAFKEGAYIQVITPKIIAYNANF